MSNKTKVIILCGGKGQRLAPLTDHIPKPLVPLKEKPILQHILKFYMDRNMDKFILCTGYGAEAIEKFISVQKFKAEIEVSNIGETASMLSRLYAVRHLIDERAIVTYGDTFINIDISRMVEEHLKNRAALTMTVTDIRSPFGVVDAASNGGVTSFQEKPYFTYYIGHMVIEKEVLENLESRFLEKPDGEGLVELWQSLLKKKELYAYRHQGLQLTFNTWQEHQKAEEEFVKFFTQQESQA